MPLAPVTKWSEFSDCLEVRVTNHQSFFPLEVTLTLKSAS